MHIFVKSRDLLDLQVCQTSQCECESSVGELFENNIMQRRTKLKGTENNHDDYRQFFSLNWLKNKKKNLTGSSISSSYLKKSLWIWSSIWQVNINLFTSIIALLKLNFIFIIFHHDHHHVSHFTHDKATLTTSTSSSQGRSVYKCWVDVNHYFILNHTKHHHSTLTTSFFRCPLKSFKNVILLLKQCK